MKRDDILEKLNEIFRSVFDDESIILSDETTPNDIEDWDSLEQINIINAVQSEFKISLSIDEALSLLRVGDFVDCILNKLV